MVKSEFRRNLARLRFLQDFNQSDLLGHLKWQEQFVPWPLYINYCSTVKFWNMPNVKVKKHRPPEFG